MIKKLKTFLTDKNSTVTFNQDSQCFEIDDHAGSQFWLLRIIGISMLFFSLLGYFRSDEFSLLYVILTLVFTVVLILSFTNTNTNTNTTTVIPLDQIQSVVYRKSAKSATGSIKLKNKTHRVLYHYDLTQFEDQIQLFKSHGVDIKNKTSWF